MELDHPHCNQCACNTAPIECLLDLDNLVVSSVGPPVRARIAEWIEMVWLLAMFPPQQSLKPLQVNLL